MVDRLHCFITAEKKGGWANRPRRSEELDI